jgi:hypothetical protein
MSKQHPRNRERSEPTRTKDPSPAAQRADILSQRASSGESPLPVTTSRRWVPRFRALAFWSAAALVFAVSHTQALLYSENQTTKFLVGLARAGRGELARDWLAGAIDALPAFTALVELTYCFLPEAAFYVFYAVLTGVYLYALYGIADRTVGLRRSRARSAVFLAALVVVHSRLVLHMAAVWGLGDLPLLFRHGLAGQYVLGPIFQPSVFGVFLLLAVRLFLEDRRIPAALALAVATVFHPAYVLTAAALTLAFALVTAARTRRPATTLGPVLLVLALTAPVVVYTRLAFAATDPSLWREGLRFLVHQRIPHHSLPEVWFDRGALFQVLLMAAGIVAAGRTRLRPVLVIPFALGLGLTGLQLATGSDALALLAPWRISAILVPASVAILLGRLSAVLVPPRPRRAFRGRTLPALSGAAIAVCVLSGVRLQWTTIRDRDRSPEVPLYAFVRAHLAPGDLYVVPPRDHRLDPFRLATGAPILINWKSHPYRLDDEFAEWRRRMERAEGLYAAPADSVCASSEALARAYGVTHVVVRLGAGDGGNRLVGGAPGPPDPVCPGWREVYRNRGYAVYRLPAGSTALPLGSRRGVP